MTCTEFNGNQRIKNDLVNLLILNLPFKKLSRNLFKALCNPVYKHEEDILSITRRDKEFF